MQLSTFRIFLLLVVAVLILAPSRPAFAQDERGVLKEVEASLGTADIGKLGHRAADRVEVTLFGSAAMYSRGQAMYVLANFFREYPPVRVVLNEPSRSGANWFALGSYFHEAGKQPLRVFIRLRSKEGRWELREIRIEQRSGS
ncbi:MAG: DUF4783 domain-containing protein [Bacteroidota bacterium]